MDLTSQEGSDIYKMISAGAVVVGNYNHDGLVVKQSQINVSPEELEKQRRMTYGAAVATGGRLIESKKKLTVPKGKKDEAAPKAKRGRKPKVAVDPGPPSYFADDRPLTGQPDPYSTQSLIDDEAHFNFQSEPEKRVERFPIYLHNQMGKIKMQVLEVLECELAYCLVFNHEDDVIFTPNAGELLHFTHFNGKQTDVYYPNAYFNWIDGNKKLMILFKNDETIND